MGEEILKVEGIKFNVGSQSILRDISFKLIRGETIAVIGPSGSGKSTLLGLLNRLYEPSGGIIHYLGTPLQEYPVLEVRRKIGMVMQQPVLFPGTIRDNLIYGPALQGKEDSLDIEGILELVGLQKACLEKEVSQLSGGEKQRVAFARTLANEPEVLLLDEPTSALDPGSTEIIEGIVDEQKSRNLLSVIWVTHSLEQAFRVADKVLLITRGTVGAFGPPNEVLRGDQVSVAGFPLTNGRKGDGKDE